MCFNEPCGGSIIIDVLIMCFNELCGGNIILQVLMMCFNELCGGKIILRVNDVPITLTHECLSMINFVHRY